MKTSFLSGEHQQVGVSAVSRSPIRGLVGLKLAATVGLLIGCLVLLLSSSLASAASTTTNQNGPSKEPKKGVAAAQTNGQIASKVAPLESAESRIENAKVELGVQDQVAAAAGHHGKSHDHGKYYMYAEVPKKGAYKMGFKRGNHKHLIERKESAHKTHVHSYFKWHDKKGKGSHKFEFKHGHHKKGHY